MIVWNTGERKGGLLWLKLGEMTETEFRERMRICRKGGAD